MEKSIGNRISTYTEKEFTSIIVYPKRTRWKEAVLFAWVISFSIIGFYMIYLLIGGGLEKIDNTGLEGDPEEVLRNQKIYLGVFVGFWIYFEYKVVKGLLWLTMGKELIKISKDALSVKNSILSYGRSNSYFFENIKGMGLVEHEKLSFGFDYENAFWRKGTDSIIFDHRAKTVSFARKLNEKDSRLLHRFILDRIKKQSKVK
jgi:hypothetical protein